jgi:hypothetical protein
MLLEAGAACEPVIGWINMPCRSVKGRTALLNQDTVVVSVQVDNRHTEGRRPSNHRGQHRAPSRKESRGEELDSRFLACQPLGHPVASGRYP